MTRLLYFADYLLGLYAFILLVTAIASWLLAFDVMNARNNLVRSTMNALSALTEPVIAPIRGYVPSPGGLDLSFMIVLLAIEFIRSVLIADFIDVLK